jgi:hypothetical protein
MKILTLALLLIMPLCAARADEDLWKVYLLSRDSVADCTLDSVSESALFVTSHGNRIPLPLDSIARLRFEKRSRIPEEAANGLLVGMVVGGAIGYLASGGETEQGIVHFGTGEFVAAGIVGGVMYGYGIGAIIGAIHAVDPKYDLRALDRSGKRDLIRRILVEYAPLRPRQD